MFARITEGHLAEESSWDTFQLNYQGALEDMGHVPGLEARILVQEAKEGARSHVLMISLWRDESAAASYESSEFYREKLVPALSSLLDAPMQTARCDVRFIETYGG